MLRELLSKGLIISMFVNEASGRCDLILSSKKHHQSFKRSSMFVAKFVISLRLLGIISPWNNNIRVYKLT